MSAPAHCSQCGAQEDQTPFGHCVCGAAYCGARCQKAAWTSHKAVCPAVVPRQVEGKDLGMVATRRLKPGDVISTELPIFKIKDGFRDKSKQVFLASYKDMDPVKREELLSLYDPGTEQVKWICDPELDVEGADKAWRILYSNGIGVGIQGEQVTAVYPTLSRINHACQANTFQRCSGEARAISFIACTDISKNQEVTLNYLGPSSILLSKQERRERLCKNWFFDCNCHVCCLEGDMLQLNENIRSTLQSFKDQIIFVTNSNPRDYTLGKAEAAAAMEEERKKAGIMGEVAKQVVAALGPSSIPMLKLELESIYFTFKQNMSDISYHL